MSNSHPNHHTDWCSPCWLQTCYAAADDLELLTYLSLPFKCWGAELHHHTLFVNFACWSRISVKLIVSTFCFASVVLCHWGSYHGPCTLDAMASPGSVILNPVFSLFSPVFTCAVQLYQTIHGTLKSSPPSLSSLPLEILPFAKLKCHTYFKNLLFLSCPVTATVILFSASANLAPLTSD